MHRVIVLAPAALSVQDSYPLRPRPRSIASTRLLASQRMEANGITMPKGPSFSLLIFEGRVEILALNHNFPGQARQDQEQRTCPG